MPTAVGVYSTEQEAVNMLTPTGPVRAQLGALKVPVPVLVKLTEPDGRIFVPEERSVTVVVQVEAVPTLTGAGLQLSVVSVARKRTGRSRVPELVL